MKHIQVNGNFQFRKAGQGCFYTGKISTLNKKFHFVYDCGSLKYGEHILKSEISKYKAELDNNEIDLLVISHVDSDHCNYVINLLDNNVHCKCVVLPYLTEIERVILAFRYRFLGGNDDDYIAFLQNPTEFFDTRGVDSIIYINGLEGSDIAVPQIPNPTLPDKFELSEKTIDILTNLSGVDNLNLSTDNKKGANKTKKSKVYEASGSIKLFAGLVWEFNFYAKKQSPELIDAFRENLTKQGLLEEGMELNFKSFNTIITNQGNRTKAKKTYNKFFKDKVNICSLIVMHQPILNEDYLYHWNYNLRIPSTLLLGDITLKEYDMPVYIANMRYRRYIQIPHHGSDASWDLLKFVRIDSSYSKVIINYGIGNTYGHPGERVTEDLRIVLDKKIFLNTQFDSYQYNIKYFFGFEELIA